MAPYIHVAGGRISTFGLAALVALMASGLLFARRARERSLPEARGWEAPLVAAACGLVGARLYSIAQNGLGGHPLGSGLIWYGGLIGGVAGALAWARLRRVPRDYLIEGVALITPVGYAIARVGCLLAGDGDYGRASHLPWAMAFPHGVVPTPPGVRVHPTPIYETLAVGLIAWWLWRRRDELAAEVLLSLYLLLGGLERFLVEFVRRNEAVAGGLTAAQLESLALMAVGAAWLLVRRGRARTPAPRQVTTRTSWTNDRLKSISHGP